LRHFLFVILILTAIASAQTAHPQQSNSQTQTIAQRIAADAAKVDVNTATAQQLMSLPGVTDMFAARIIAGRPYKSKLDLLRRGVVSANLYSRISEKIIAHRVKPTTPPAAAK